MKCITCGKEFEPKRKDARFCSSYCRVKSNRKPQTEPVVKSPTEDFGVADGLKLVNAAEVNWDTAISSTGWTLNSNWRTSEDNTKTVGSFDDAIDSIQKKFGPEVAIDIRSFNHSVSLIRSGSPCVDLATGGGLPQGRVIEMYGFPSAGKTTLALSMLAEAQKQGLQSAFIDMEHAINLEYATKLGVDTSFLFFAQPDYGEQALQLVEEYINNGARFIVVDSVAAMIPKAELEGEIGEAHVGRQARMMGQGLRKLIALVDKTGTVLIFINQMRSNIGPFVTPTTTPGGWALKFYSSLRLEVARTHQIKEGDQIVGSELKVKVIKNKFAMPQREALLKLYFGEGVSRDDELYSIGKKAGLISKSGGNIDSLVEKLNGVEDKDIIKVINNYYGNEAENREEVE